MIQPRPTCPPRLHGRSPLHRIADALERMSPPPPPTRSEPILTTSLKDAGFGYRIFHNLQREPVEIWDEQTCQRKSIFILTVADLIRCTEDDILYVRNIGMTSVAIIRIKLAELGLKLKGD